MGDFAGAGTVQEVTSFALVHAEDGGSLFWPVVGSILGVVALIAVVVVAVLVWKWRRDGGNDPFRQRQRARAGRLRRPPSLLEDPHPPGGVVGTISTTVPSSFTTVHDTEGQRTDVPAEPAEPPAPRPRPWAN